MSKSRLSPVLAALAVILLMVLLISCRGKPTTAQAPTPTRSLASTVTPMPAPHADSGSRYCGDAGRIR